MLGVITLALFGGAAFFWFHPPTGADAEQLHAACWRIGALCGALWLAYDHLQRVPIWIWAFLPVVLIVLARRPVLLLALIPVVLAVAILKPRKPRRG